MNRTFAAAIFTAVAALTLAGSANAVPFVGANKAALSDAAASGSVEQVHYRKWRHSHRRSYRHGRRGGSYGYNRRPGIYLNFGGSRRDRSYSDYRDYDRQYR